MFGNRYFEIIRKLVEHGVDFIIIGGVAAVLHGAPVSTFDLDAVHSTAPDNVSRLLKALDELDAYYRIQPDLHLRPQRSHLESTGHQLLLTRLGMLDLLGSVGPGRGYAELLPCSSEMDLQGTRFRVLNLETVIRLKEEIGGEKDLAVLPLLRRALHR